MRVLTTALLLVVILASSAATQERSTATSLTEAMAERLALMAPVAAYKWNAGRPIEDLAREQVVLDKVVESAVAKGVDVDLARSFFQAQISAAKLVQQRHFDLWRAEGQGKFAAVRDLKNDLRPAIIALTGRIIEDLGRLPGVPASRICEALQPTPATLAEDATAWAVAVGPLKELAGGCASN